MKTFLVFCIVVLVAFSSCATRVVTPAPQTNVVVVKKAPRNHRVVVVKGKRYYKWNGRYHRKTANGYMVVRL